MNKTVEQAVEETRGGEVYVVGREDLNCHNLGWYEDKYYWYNAGSIVALCGQHICSRGEYNKAAAQWKAKQGKEWVDGLPPVGARCEFRYCETLNDDGTWMPAKVIGYDGDDCVVSISRFCYKGSAVSDDFRPLQSDRDKAIEEMTKAYMEGASDHRGGIQAIYDAGFRRHISREVAAVRLGKYFGSNTDEDVTGVLDALGFEGFDQ